MKPDTAKGTELAELRDALAYAAQKQDALERELHALAAKVSALEAHLRKPDEAAGEIAEDLPQFEDVEPGIVKVLIAAAAAALGRNVRLISARLLPPAVDAVSAWSQQGRVTVQTSHNIR